MRPINNNPSLENQLLRLTDDQKQNLYGVLDDFFKCFHLQDVREMLWNWLVAAMSSEGAYDSGNERNNLFFLYEKLEGLIEATHEINKRRMKKLHRKMRKRKNRKQVSFGEQPE